MKNIYPNKVSEFCFTFFFVLTTITAFYQITIKGKILDKSKVPLVGASVTVNASQGTTTLADGTFLINNVKLPATLKVSFIGYENKQIKIENAEEIYEIILADDIQNLEQVVVSASRKPEKVTESPASISVLNARTIKTQPTQGDALNLLKNTQGVRLINNGIAKTNITMRGQALVNETLTLEPIGNHCRGTAFLDNNFLINQQLNQVFDKIASTVRGFHYGRFDLKVKSIDDLYEGKNIKILELNGVWSEPAHIYDPNFKLWKAYKDLFWHWNTMSKISLLQSQKGIKTIPTKVLLKKVKKYFV
ncbi:MAG: carboxypeptidase-like regulatory domain-containing protein [Pseudarcicella sp.]|nr:carboxypeptidase-like regulatory domain-containing protein [Pseudarcicella sp.]